MKNETICECGHRKERHECNARAFVEHECNHDAWCEADWCECLAFIPQVKSLRDELFTSCNEFHLPTGHRINKTFIGKWGVFLGDVLVIEDFDAPEAAFAWLKDHLKEQK